MYFEHLQKIPTEKDSLAGGRELELPAGAYSGQYSGRAFLHWDRGFESTPLLQPVTANRFVCSGYLSLRYAAFIAKL